MQKMCVNSPNLFHKVNFLQDYISSKKNDILCLSEKLFPKLNFQNLLDLLLTKSIFLSLLFFYVAMKNVKAKVKKIQILLSTAVHSVGVILLIHHIWLNGLMIKISRILKLTLDLNKNRIKVFQFVTGI